MICERLLLYVYYISTPSFHSCVFIKMRREGEEHGWLGCGVRDSDTRCHPRMGGTREACSGVMTQFLLLPLSSNPMGLTIKIGPLPWFNSGLLWPHLGGLGYA